MAYVMGCGKATHQQVTSKGKVGYMLADARRESGSYNKFSLGRFS